MKFSWSRNDVARSLRADTSEPTADDLFVDRLASVAASKAGPHAQPRPGRARLAGVAAAVCALTVGGGLGVAYGVGFVEAPWSPEPAPTRPVESSRPAPKVPTPSSSSGPESNRPGETHPSHPLHPNRAKGHGKAKGKANGNGNGNGKLNGKANGHGHGHGHGKAKTKANSKARIKTNGNGNGKPDGQVNGRTGAKGNSHR